MPAPSLPWLAPVIAHRGASAVAPENTLAAIRRAGELGASWVEVDVRRAASGELVLMHDATLDRTTNGRGNVAETPYKTLAGLDAGIWFGPGFAGEPIPTLEAFLRLAEELGLCANVEIKAEASEAEEMGRDVAMALREHWPAHRATALISSTSPKALGAAAKAAPDFPRGLVVDQVPNEAALRDQALGCVSVHTNNFFLTQAKTALLTRLGYAALVYTVNRVKRAKTLYAWGVAAIFTDYPEPERWC